MNWLFGGGRPPQTGYNRGPTAYDANQVFRGNSPWYGGVGASATDPTSIPGYTGRPVPGGIRGPQPYPGQQNNPYSASAVLQQPRPQQSQQPVININIPGGTQTTSPASPPQASGAPAFSPAPVAPSPPSVNQWGRSPDQESQWLAQQQQFASQQLAADQLAATQAQAQRDALASQQVATEQEWASRQQTIASQQLASEQLAATQAQAVQDELARQQSAAFAQWLASERLKQQEFRNQWQAYLAAVNGMPDPDWNQLPVFQMLQGLQPASAFQARGQAAQQAMVGPTMPKMPGPPTASLDYPLNDWTTNPANDAAVRQAMQELRQEWTNLNQMYAQGGPAPKPIRLNLPDAHKVNYQTLANLLPSERALLESGIRSQGQSPDDYLEAVLRSAPRGRGVGMTGWG